MQSKLPTAQYSIETELKGELGLQMLDKKMQLEMQLLETSESHSKYY
jgi:hypothetical protein